VQRTACVTHLSYRSLLPQGAPTSDQAASFSLGAVRSPQFQLLRVQGTLAGHPATLLIDCGATNDFVSADFVQRHALSLAPTTRTVRGYDGTATPSPGLLRAPLLLTTTSYQTAVPLTEPLPAHRCTARTPSSASLGCSRSTRSSTGRPRPPLCTTAARCIRCC
jgi:hypothetical protein